MAGTKGKCGKDRAKGKKGDGKKGKKREGKGDSDAHSSDGEVVTADNHPFPSSGLLLG
jgi:hypothetical protein